MMETDYYGPSPIADPDLAMVDPKRYTETDAPTLQEHLDLLRCLIGAAELETAG